MRRPIFDIRKAVILAAILFGAAETKPAAAQVDFSALGGPGGGRQAAKAPVTVVARIEPAAKNQPPRLIVTADIGEGWHIYSLTQEGNGPVPSKITLEPSEAFKLASPFKAETEPKVSIEPAFDNLPVESHEGRTTWSAPLELAAGADLSTLAIAGKLSYQACNASSCLPPTSVKFTARAGEGGATPDAKGSAPQAAAESAGRSTAEKPAGEKLSAAAIASEYHPAASHLTLRGYLEPKSAAPGAKVRLVIIAEPAADWHLYALADRDPRKGSKPTLVALALPAGWGSSPPTADRQPIERDSTVFPNTIERFYEKPVSWVFELTVPADASAREYEIGGQIGFQTCRDEQGCDMPQAAKFSATMPVGPTKVDGQIPLRFDADKSYKQVSEAAEANPSAAAPTQQLDLNQLQPAGSPSSERSLLTMMLIGFAGGLILNVMPCVLPVIGLKILGFVEQSHESRGRVLALNVWYSLGMFAVFMVLATLPVAFNLIQDKKFGWGQQFAYDGFNITLTAIVFVMALSFIGVWEIPIPGFVGSGKTNELASKEGALGAFVKGALTTVLATPCSGPLLSTALAFAVSEPPHLTYTMFAAIAVGMASPYLLIGAFPRLLRYLPKPGPWMDTFKQAMGFVLLGTVVYLATLIHWPSVIPTVALLVGLWAGCWWIGRTPLYAELGVKLRAWIGGAAIATIVGIVAFNWLGPIMSARFQLVVDSKVQEELRGMQARDSRPLRTNTSQGGFELPWEPFSFDRLQTLTSEGKTVMLDFTADWCPTCHTLKNFVLDTEGTRKLVEENGVVPLLVDMTRFPDEEAQLLDKLAGVQLLPVLAIFPAGRPNAPIVLRETYTQGLLLEKLREAGPSKDVSQRTALKDSR